MLILNIRGRNSFAPTGLNLNGLWDYAITPNDAPQPEVWDGQILVLFPAESLRRDEAGRRPAPAH
jgi:hypothetical protein